VARNPRRRGDRRGRVEPAVRRAPRAARTARQPAEGWRSKGRAGRARAIAEVRRFAGCASFLTPTSGLRLIVPAGPPGACSTRPPARPRAVVNWERPPSWSRCSAAGDAPLRADGGRRRRGGGAARAAAPRRRGRGRAPRSPRRAGRGGGDRRECHRDRDGTGTCSTTPTAVVAPGAPDRGRHAARSAGSPGREASAGAAEPPPVDAGPRWPGPDGGRFVTLGTIDRRRPRWHSRPAMTSTPKPADAGPPPDAGPGRPIRAGRRLDARRRTAPARAAADRDGRRAAAGPGGAAAFVRRQQRDWT